MFSRDEVRSKIPSEFRLLYQFHGTIHPASAKAKIPDMGIARMRIVFAKSEFSACLYVTGDSGEFCADLYAINEITDLASTRNALREHINAQLDMSCLYDGFPYHAEVHQCLKPSGEKVELSVYSPIVRAENQKYEKRVAKEVLTTHKCFPFLTYAIKDFRRAIQDPLETHALIFRSVESIRNYYAEINGLDTEEKIDRNKSWEILRETLKYNRDDFRFLEDSATARRHGQVAFSDANEIEKCMSFAWNFLIRFIEHTFDSQCIAPPKVGD